VKPVVVGFPRLRFWSGLYNSDVVPEIHPGENLFLNTAIPVDCTFIEIEAPVSNNGKS
jgi:hypothetical protein